MGLRSCILNLLAAASLHAEPPNIVFIVSDDQRADTISALGNPRIHTPALDSLVRRGVTFTRAVATYPICHVSRVEMLTGCPAHRAYKNYPNPPVDPSLSTLPRTFAESGYEVCYSGKWHTNGTPQHHGYTSTSGLYSSGGGNGKALTFPQDHAGRTVTGYTGWTFKSPTGAPEPEKGIGLTPSTDRHVADGAIRFLMQRDRSKPFFLHVNFTAPHDPRHWPEGKQRYKASDMKLPANFRADHPFDHGNIAGRDEKLLPRPLQETTVLEEIACYYATVTEMDEQVGRLLESLQEHGLADNTIILFTTDQGLALGSHGLLGKQNLYEHTISVPLIFAGPHLPENSRSSVQCCLYDIFPTLCELVGLQVPSTVQGKSLVRALHGEQVDIYPQIMAHFTDTQTMVRENRFKLIHYWKQNRDQLFDLEADPMELRDLSASADRSETLMRLKGALRKQ